MHRLKKIEVPSNWKEIVLFLYLVCKVYWHGLALRPLEKLEFRVYAGDIEFLTAELVLKVLLCFYNYTYWVTYDIVCKCYISFSNVAF